MELYVCMYVCMYVYTHKLYVHMYILRTYIVMYFVVCLVCFDSHFQVLKWSFSTPRSEFVEQLKDQMQPCVSRPLLTQLFHDDFKQHIAALGTLKEVCGVLCVHTHVCTHTVCTYVCMYVLYVCMYVCVYVNGR